MVNKNRIRDTGDADNVQDLGMLGLQRSADGTLQDESSGGMLSLGSMRLHNAHVADGRGVAGECRICSEGMGGVLAPVEARGPRGLAVVESSGTDGEGATPSSADSGTSEREDSLLWQ